MTKVTLHPIFLEIWICTPHSLHLYSEQFLVWIMTPILGIPFRGFFNVNGNDYMILYTLELVDCVNSMPKVVVGTVFIADIVGSPMGIIYLHYTHTRHKYVFGKITTHQKWNIEEYIYWHTQHQTTYHITTNNLHCKSCPQFLKSTSHQAFYHVV